MKELKDQMEVALLRKARYDPGKILREYRLEKTQRPVQRRQEQR